MASSPNREAILAAYPYLEEEEDVWDALRYAAGRAQEQELLLTAA